MKKLLVAVCGALLLAGCVNTKKSNRPLTVLQNAPEFSLRNVKGGEVKSADLKGKVVVIDFWATWCPPCKEEIPKFNDLYARMKEKGVEVVGVTFESDNPVKDVLPFMDEFKMAYPVALGTDELDAALGGHLGLPTTFLIGKDWKVYRKIPGNNGESKMQGLEKDIDALLAKTAD